MRSTFLFTVISDGPVTKQEFRYPGTQSDRTAKTAQLIPSIQFSYLGELDCARAGTMAEIDVSGGPGDDQLPIQKLPPGALQAIYHAVTGKTESMSKDLSGSVIIEQRDTENLYEMLRNQLAHYELICSPTVTVVIKYENDKTVTYSSWERFKALEWHHSEITSEITIKIEVVIRLPGTAIDQRLIINVMLDSSLPVIKKYREDRDDLENVGFFLYIRRDWITAKISIDFVDFLVARIFTGVVEEWFNNLHPTPKSKTNVFLFNRTSILQAVIKEFPRIGMAVFAASFALFNVVEELTPLRLLMALAISLILWSILSVSGSSLSRSLHRRSTQNIIPTVILLTEGDKRAYEFVKDKTTSAIFTVGLILFTAIFNISINIISSYIYSGS